MTPPAPQLRRDALQRADEAMQVIRSSAYRLRRQHCSTAVTHLNERADTAGDIVQALRAGTRRDLGLGLTVAIALSELVEQIEHELPDHLGPALMSASADVLEALSDVAALGFERPPL